MKTPHFRIPELLQSPKPVAATSSGARLVCVPADAVFGIPRGGGNVQMLVVAGISDGFFMVGKGLTRCG